MDTKRLDRAMPPGLEELAGLALDLRWTGSHLASRVWATLDATAWERTRNPYIILLNAHQERLEKAAADQTLRRELEAWLTRRRQYDQDPGWYGRRHTGAALKRVAYFSMEFGLSEGLPIYSGGLGILAGDHLKSASDLGVPLVGIGLLYQQGYFRQVLADDARQLEAFPYNDPGSLPVSPVRGPDGRWPRVRISLPGRTLLLRVWQARVGRVTLYLLDSNDPMNGPWDRAITANLYAAGKEKRLLQEIVLGVGGWRLLEKLGIEVDVCHLNEGHAAFAVLARARSFAERSGLPFRTALRVTRAGNVFTTHTPVDAAFDRFDPALMNAYATPTAEQMGITLDELLGLGRLDPGDRGEPFNMAYLALRGCGHVNGVSRLHGEVSRPLFGPLFPGWPFREVPVGSITNGVHVPTWDSEPAHQLWSRTFTRGKWLDHLEEASAAIAQVSDEDLWRFRAEARQQLVEYVRRRLHRQVVERGSGGAAEQRAAHVLDPNALTLGFARRFTAYKRPNLLLHDPERLARILRDAERPVQLVVAGKAHPDDEHGKSMVQAIARFTARPDLPERAVFLQDYDMAVAQHLAAGIDVWINTPRRPNEACGTSGMKMLANGGLNLSSLDGWWDEAYAPDLGWALGDASDHAGVGDTRDADHLYDLLEQRVIPEFYDRDGEGIPRAWVARVRNSMSRLTAPFSSDRMVREYVEQVYVPAAEAIAARTADGARRGSELEAWMARVEEAWSSLRFGELRVHLQGGRSTFHVQVYLGGLRGEDVGVELYADPMDGQRDATIIPMRLEGPIPGAVNGYRYAAELSAARPAEHYTPRVRPHHVHGILPLEFPRIAWWSGHRVIESAVGPAEDHAARVAVAAV
jgi:starch phosphorylase